MIEWLSFAKTGVDVVEQSSPPEWELKFKIVDSAPGYASNFLSLNSYKNLQDTLRHGSNNLVWP